MERQLENQRTVLNSASKHLKDELVRLGLIDRTDRNNGDDIDDGNEQLLGIDIGGLLESSKEQIPRQIEKMIQMIADKRMDEAVQYYQEYYQYVMDEQGLQSRMVRYVRQYGDELVQFYNDRVVGIDIQQHHSCQNDKRYDWCYSGGQQQQDQDQEQEYPQTILQNRQTLGVLTSELKQLLSFLQSRHQQSSSSILQAYDSSFQQQINDIGCQRLGCIIELVMDLISLITKQSYHCLLQIHHDRAGCYHRVYGQLIYQQQLIQTAKIAIASHSDKIRSIGRTIEQYQQTIRQLKQKNEQKKEELEQIIGKIINRTVSIRI